MNPELSYLAGLFEGEGTISIEIRREPRCRYGIRLFPYVEFTISLDDSIIIEDFKKYIHVNWLTVTKREHNVIKIRLRDQESIKQFIEILSPYFRLPTTQRKAEIMLKILSKMGKHKRGGFSKNEFIELLNLTKELKSLQKKQRNRAKTKIDYLISKISSEPCEPADEGNGGKPFLNAGSFLLQ